MTFASGHKFFEDPCFWVFVKSFVKNTQDVDLVIITQEMSEEVEEKLFQLGVADVVRTTGKETQFFFRDRHLSYWKYLNLHGHKYQHVLSIDSRDVIFQANPFDWIPIWKSRFDKIKGHHDFLNHFVILMAEGHKLPQSGFGCIEQFEFERDVPRPYIKEDKDRFVVNGGVAMGSTRAMQDFHFLVWMTTLKTIGRCTDQATINWLLYYLDQDDAYQISFPFNDHLCLTGEGIKMGAVEPILKEDGVYSKDNNLYYIVHQWDRIDHLREQILSQYQMDIGATSRIV